MKEQVSKCSCAKVIHHGPGALSRLDEEIRKLNGSRVALVTDPGLVEAGVVDRVLECTKTELLVYQGVRPEPPYEVVHRCVDFLKENGCDLVIGLGGGSSMDVAKMAAVMMANVGRVSDYWGADRIPRPGLPIIAIPTTAGTGSEVSPAAVFVDPSDEAKKGVRSDFLLPEVAILDPVLTLGLPQLLTASTGMDALVHALEAYTSTKATLMSDAMAEQAIAVIGNNLRAAYARGNSLPARTSMLLGSLLAGMALGEAGVGAVHALAHVLGGRHGVGHGVANALFLPYVMAFNRIGCREKYAKVASLLGERVEGLSLDQASLAAVEAVRTLSGDLGIPQRLSDLGIPEDSLDLMAETSMQTQGRILANNPRVVSLSDAKRILREAY